LCDQDGERSPSPDSPGPRGILKAPFSPRFQPPTIITKYTRETKPAVWPEDFQLACRVREADDDYFIIQYLPICVREYVRVWLEFLLPNTIRSWAELKLFFVENFQGTYVRPGNCWDLKSCKQEPSESLRDFIHRFSKQCNSLPDIIDADVVSTFLSGTICKSLVHKLGCRKPCTTHELLALP
jgi:hypothetical protein